MKVQEKKPRSGRRYPERICFNQACIKEFTPHDRRQKFCCEQCRVDYYNDRRHFANNSTFRNEKILRDCDAKTAKIFFRFADKSGFCEVPLILFQHEGIDLRLAIEENENTKTGGRVRWFYKYGTEIHPRKPGYLIVHKR